MGTSNSRYFTVHPTPPTPGTGWQVKVRDYRDFTTLVAVLNEFSALMAGTELNAVGVGAANDGGAGGSLTLDADHPFWATTLIDGAPATKLRDHEYLWEAWIDGVRVASWLGNQVQEDFAADGETRTITISGPGPSAAIAWAKVFPPNYPKPKPTPQGYIWPWTSNKNMPVMEIWLWLLHQAQGRGTITWLKPTFTKTHDSGGVTWSDVTTVFNRLVPMPVQLGTDMLSLLNALVGQDLLKVVGMRADWVLRPDLKLDIRPTIGSHKETRVIFYESDTVLSNQRTRVRDAVVNHVVISDATYLTNAPYLSVATDSASVAAWQRREYYEEVTNAVLTTRRDAIAQLKLKSFKYEKSSWTITLDPEHPGRRPWRDFDLGDWIGIARMQPDHSITVEAYRVMAITVNVDDSGKAVMELVLQTKLDALLHDLQSQIATLANQIGSLASSGGTTLPAGGTTVVPLTWNPTSKAWGPGVWPPAGSGGGIKMFIQQDNPGTAASVGDLWYQPSTL